LLEDLGADRGGASGDVGLARVVQKERAFAVSVVLRRVDGSAKSVPCSTIAAPSSRMRATFTGFGAVGRKIRAWTPCIEAANATAAP
jgi:hypothetical protein